MSSQTFGQKLLKPIPPMKGSFPLDHSAECKTFMQTYFQCLSEHNYANTACRDLAKAYFECRMTNNLMDKEDFRRLGYGDVVASEEQTSSAAAASDAVIK